MSRIATLKATNITNLTCLQRALEHIASSLQIRLRELTAEQREQLSVAEGARVLAFAIIHLGQSEQEQATEDSHRYGSLRQSTLTVRPSVYDRAVTLDDNNEISTGHLVLSYGSDFQDFFEQHIGPNGQRLQEYYNREVLLAEQQAKYGNTATYTEYEEEGLPMLKVDLP